MRVLFLDRRSGFDRRGDDSSFTARLRGHDLWVAILLLTINFLNVADLVYTAYALGAGAHEANPIMAALFASDPMLGAAVKLAVVATVTVILWVFRRYRTILQMQLASATLFVGIGLYHATLHLVLVH